MAPRKNPAPKDTDVIVPDATVVVLESGNKVEIVPLKTRQFFKLLKIITRGAGDALTSLRLDPDDSDVEFATKLIATFGFAIPEAESEAIDFIQSMCKPIGLIERPAYSLNKQDKERNDTLWVQLVTELDNPELGDTFSIIEAVVTRETPNLKALGKRLGQMFDLAKKTGQVPETKPSSTE